MRTREKWKLPLKRPRSAREFRKGTLSYFIGLGCQKAYLKAAFYLYLENLTRLCLEFIKDSIGE